MANKVILNKRGSVNWRDWVNGLIMASLVSALTALQQILDSNNGVNFKVVGMAAVSGIVGYVLKKILERPSVVTTYSSNEKAEQIAEDIKEG